MGPIVDEITEELGIEVLKVDITTGDDYTLIEKHQVSAAPTFVILDDDGLEIGRKIGGMSEVQFRMWLEETDGKEDTDTRG